MWHKWDLSAFTWVRSTCAFCHKGRFLHGMVVDESRNWSEWASVESPVEFFINTSSCHTEPGLPAGVARAVLSRCPPSVLGEHWVCYCDLPLRVCVALMAKPLLFHAFLAAVPETLPQIPFLSWQAFQCLPSFGAAKTGSCPASETALTETREEGSSWQGLLPCLIEGQRIHFANDSCIRSQK